LIVTVVRLARAGGLRSVVAESLLVKHGTVRRECLDRALFWTATDLEAKLLDFQHYYNEHRTPAGRQGYPSGNVRQRRSLTSKSQLFYRGGSQEKIRLRPLEFVLLPAPPT
jgi:hypothetical protein